MKFSSLLEEKMRNDPESYVEEFDSRLRYLTSLMETLRVSPKGVPEKDCSDLVALLTQVVRPLHGPDALKQLVDPIMVLLSTAHVHTLSSTMIQALVQGIISLRSKDLVPFSVSVPLFVQLLHLKDRHIRRTLLRTIAADISRLNNKGKQRTENRQLQTQMFGLVQQEDGMRSRYALSLMIDLYRRKVWNDSLCVHYISLAALNRESCTKRMALNFILGRAYRLGTVTALMEDDDAEEHHGNATDTGKRIAHLHKQFRVRKKNRGRERKLKNKVMSLSKEYGHNKGDEELNGTDAYHVLQPQQNPILFLRNPQQFAEDLFHQLQRTTEKFDMRLLMMTALARVIATHQLLLLDIYAYLQRYMEPYQREVTSIMALTVECTHNLVPPDVITPLLQTIANHFVTDRSSSDAITVGLNTIREICKRSPTALPTDLLHDLIQYSSRHQRGTADAKGVIMAARSLLRFYRRVQPSLLPSRMRGRNHDLTKQMTPYGHFVPSTGVAGIELLSCPDTLDDHEEGSDKEESDDGEDSVCLSLEDTSQEGSGEEMEEEEEVDQGSGEEMEEEEEGSSEEMEEEEEEAPELIPVIPNSSGNKIPTTQITLNPSITPDDVMDRILTQEDFERIAKLRQRRDLSTHTGKDSKTVKKMLRGKRERDRKEDEVTETVDPETLELHSTKKQCRDKEERLKKIRESRERHTIQYRKSIKKGTKSNSEKRKGKLYQMSQRSQAVGKKIRRSQTQSQMALKEKKKRDVKFLIKRGYGA